MGHLSEISVDGRPVDELKSAQVSVDSNYHNSIGSWFKSKVKGFINTDIKNIAKAVANNTQKPATKSPVPSIAKPDIGKSDITKADNGKSNTLKYVLIGGGIVAIGIVVAIIAKRK